MKISIWWVLLIVAVAIALAWLFFRFLAEPTETVTMRKRDTDTLVTLKLPNASNPEVFGPRYWESFHALAGMIPCSACRQDAMPLEVFKHDFVNLKLKKPVYDKANWKKHVAMVNELDRTV